MKKFILLIVVSLVCFSNAIAFATDQSGEAIENSYQKLDLNASNVYVSESMSYNEMMNRIASRYGIDSREYNQVKTSFSLSTEEFSTSSLDTYREIRQYFQVTQSYTPQIEFYVKTSEYGSYWGILRIMNVTLNRVSGYMSKQFGGEVYYNLENSNTIYWKVNGDFYDNGTISVGFATEVGVGEAAKISFNISYASNHYKYCNVSNRFYAHY